MLAGQNLPSLVLAGQKLPSLVLAGQKLPSLVLATLTSGTELSLSSTSSTATIATTTSTANSAGRNLQGNPVSVKSRISMRNKGRSVGSLVPCVQKFIPREVKRLQGCSSARRLHQSSVGSPVSKRTRSRVQGSLTQAGQRKQRVRRDATEKKKEAAPKQNDVKKSISSSTDSHVCKLLEGDMDAVHQVIASQETDRKRAQNIKTESFSTTASKDLSRPRRKRGRSRKERLDEQSSESVKQKRVKASELSRASLCSVSNERKVTIDSISDPSFIPQSDTRVPLTSEDSTASDSGSPVRGTKDSSINMCQEKPASLQSPQEQTSAFDSSCVTRAEGTLTNTDSPLDLDHLRQGEASITPVSSGAGGRERNDSEPQGDEATDFFTFEVEYPAPSTPQQKMARKLARQRQLEQMRMREVVFTRRERLLRRQGMLSKVERRERKVKWNDGNLVQIFNYGTQMEEKP